ncbi:hypothetical protein JOE48_000645 [Methylobacterium sp. PvR107]|nr:hypothetical protein [Methylobacterium sp. PvR107]
MRDRPRAPFGAGGMAQEATTGDAGRRGNPGVGQSTRGIRSPRRPRHRPGMVPGRCRLSRRGVCATSRSCAGLPSGLRRGARASGTRYHSPWPSSRSPASSWADPQDAWGRPRRWSARGHFRPRRAKGRPVSRPPPRHAPYRARRPGRWRLKATDAGAAPPPDPPGQPPHGTHEGRPGIAPEPPWAGAARKHRIGILSRAVMPVAVQPVWITPRIVVPGRRRRARTRGGTPEAGRRAPPPRQDSAPPSAPDPGFRCAAPG